MEIDVEAVAGRLRQCAEAKGLSQSDVARMAGMNAANISRYFTASRLPKPGELIDLARFFGVSMEWLLTGERPDAEATKVAEEAVIYGAHRKKWLSEVAEQLELIYDKIKTEIDDP